MKNDYTKDIEYILSLSKKGMNEEVVSEVLESMSHALANGYSYNIFQLIKNSRAEVARDSRWCGMTHEYVPAAKKESRRVYKEVYEEQTKLGKSPDEARSIAVEAGGTYSEKPLFRYMNEPVGYEGMDLEDVLTDSSSEILSPEQLLDYQQQKNIVLDSMSEEFLDVVNNGFDAMAEIAGVTRRALEISLNKIVATLETQTDLLDLEDRARFALGKLLHKRKTANSGRKSDIERSQLKKKQEAEDQLGFSF
jgi:hypothetical protein